MVEVEVVGTGLVGLASARHLTAVGVQAVTDTVVLTSAEGAPVPGRHAADNDVREELR